MVTQIAAAILFFSNNRLQATKQEKTIRSLQDLGRKQSAGIGLSNSQEYHLAGGGNFGRNRRVGNPGRWLLVFSSGFCVGLQWMKGMKYSNCATLANFWSLRCTVQGGLCCTFQILLGRFRIPNGFQRVGT